MQNLKTEKLSKQDLLKEFCNGTKDKAELKIGLECEHLPLKRSNYTAVSYYEQNGVEDLLREIALQLDWKPETEGGFITGLEKGGIKISLEPGAQFEISLNPHRTVSELKTEYDETISPIRAIAEHLGIELVEYGISPITTRNEISLIPKSRYEIMSKSLTENMATVMMKQTCAVQASYDYTCEEDAIKKLSIALKLSPFMTAAFANSPIRNGKLTGYKSYRASSWLQTDANRCGLISHKLFDKTNDFSFENYVDILLNVPVMYVVRDERAIVAGSKLSFNQFIKHGYNGIEANLSDFILHSNIFFPDVRLRNYLEVRNHDCVEGDLKFAIPALYKGILYNGRAIEDVQDLLKKFSYIDFLFLRQNVPKYSLETKIGKHKVADFVKDILEISYNSLYNQDDTDYMFLEPAINLAFQGKSPADLILELFENNTAKSVKDIIKITSKADLKQKTIA